MLSLMTSEVLTCDKDRLTGPDLKVGRSAKFYSVIMPGQNGLGGGSYRESGLLHTPECDTFHFDTFRDQSKIDLGQDNCVADFDRQYQQSGLAAKRAAGKKMLLYAASQGTATVTNWLAQKTHAEQLESTGLVLLEAVLGAGNSAIEHSVANLMGRRCVPYLPFSRVWLPAVAKKMAYPAYNPRGKQAIEEARKLSPNLPIVIMHNKGDRQLSINDARKYYCAVKSQGNSNAYLMEVDKGHGHIDLLEPSDTQEISALQKIFQRQVLFSDLSGVRGFSGFDVLKAYQPSVETVEKRIANSEGAKIKLQNTIDAGFCSLIVAGVTVGGYYGGRHK